MKNKIIVTESGGGGKATGTERNCCDTSHVNGLFYFAGNTQ